MCLDFGEEGFADSVEEFVRLAESAGALMRNRDDPAKVKEHGSELAEALGEAVEKAKKSAEQAGKSGWSRLLAAVGRVPKQMEVEVPKALRAEAR